jgi:hypothetical protein
VTTTLLGPIPRYAVRELMFLSVYPPSTPNQSFSGNEFVGIIGRVEDYQRGNPENVAATVMPEQMKQGGGEKGDFAAPATPTKEPNVQ